MVHVGSKKNIGGSLNCSIAIFIACIQIWLNLPMDNCHFGCIIQLTKIRRREEHLFFPVKEKGGGPLSFQCSWRLPL
jgi:hypothetical protein